MAASFLLLVAGILPCCSGGIEVKRQFPFTVTNLPYQDKIAVGETVEIRLEIKREGFYEDTKFYIRAFPEKGKGRLCLSDGTVLTPNDLFEVKSGPFRLYYTSLGQEQHSLLVDIIDSFGEVACLKFNLSDNSAHQASNTGGNAYGL